MKRCLEDVGGGQKHIGFGGDGTDGQTGPAVESEDRADNGSDPAVEHTGANQPLGAAAFFFRRLENQFYANGQLGADFLQYGDRADQRGHVSIMAAGVHSVGKGTGVGESGLLLDGKTIDVRSQGDARFGGIADEAYRGCRGVGNAVDMRNSQPVQFGANDSGRLEFLKGQFGNSMQAMPQVR